MRKRRWASRRVPSEVLEALLILFPLDLAIGVSPLQDLLRRLIGASARTPERAATRRTATWTARRNGRTNLTGDGGDRTSARTKVVERYALTERDVLSYEATIDDPGTWTRPWTIAFPRRRDANYSLHEYACHEGNHALANILRASRAAEAGGSK
jgi:hypothetical protein